LLKDTSGIKRRVPKDLASIGNANEFGIRSVRIVQRGPLTIVKNEAVRHAMVAKISSNHRADVVDSCGPRVTRKQRAGKL